MSCVICKAAVGEPHYANAWEKARKLYPCCSEACAARFDPDVHWLPPVAPPPLAFPEEARILGAARGRIHDGDKPSIVVRDLLLAGVGIAGVRKLLVEGELAAVAGDRAARRINILGGLRALFGGGLTLGERRSKSSIEALRAANADIETWQAHFGIRGAGGPSPSVA